MAGELFTCHQPNQIQGVITITYAYCRDAALKLIDRYSISGRRIPDTYNNQSDLLARVPELINDALMLLAQTAPLEATLDLSQAAETAEDMGGGWICVHLPADTMKLSGAPAYKTTGDALAPSRQWRMLTATDMAIRAQDARGALLCYHRMPMPVSGGDGDVLDCRPDAALAVPYYVAAHLIMGADEYRAAVLLNEFHDRAERLRPVPAAEDGTVCDAYGFGGAVL